MALGILFLAVCSFAVGVFCENWRARAEIGELRTRVARLESTADAMLKEMLLSKEARFVLIGREEKIK